MSKNKMKQKLGSEVVLLLFLHSPCETLEM